MGAHFQHATEWPPLKDALTQVMTSTGIKKVALMADTNVNNGITNEDIMGKLGVSGNIVGTELTESTCCYSDFPQGYAFDRVITANLGSQMQTDVLFDNFPTWAKSTKMHKPVLGVLSGDPFLDLELTHPSPCVETSAGQGACSASPNPAYGVFEDPCCVHVDGPQCTGMPVGCAAGGLPQVCRYCHLPGSPYTDDNLPVCCAGASPLPAKQKKRRQVSLRASGPGRHSTLQADNLADDTALFQLSQAHEDGISVDVVGEDVQQEQEEL